MEVIVWLGLSIWIGIVAKNKGKSGIGWGIFSFFLSPLLGGLIVALSKNKIQDEKIKKINRKTESLREEMHYNQKFNDYKHEEMKRRIEGIENHKKHRNISSSDFSNQLLGVKTQCKNCGEENFDSKFCSNCGNELIKKVVCTNCYNEIDEDLNYCPNCGVKVAVSNCSECGAAIKIGSKFCACCGEKID